MIDVEQMYAYLQTFKPSIADKHASIWGFLNNGLNTTAYVRIERDEDGETSAQFANSLTRETAAELMVAGGVEVVYTSLRGPSETV